MARHSTKKIGALVELFRRKNKGLGIVLEVSDSKQIIEIYDPKWHDLYRQDKISEKRKQLFQCYNYYDKWPQTNHVRRYVYVKWFKRPSEWETNEILKDFDWYPADLLRAVSSVARP